MAIPAQPPDVPDLIPARMLNEFAYCPRLAYLEWVQGDFADSADTVDGRHQHRRVDKESGDLPPADRLPEDHDVLHARSVYLSAPRIGLVARIDLIEAQDGVVTPIDYKRGEAPDVPEGAWEPERVQVCAQGLILEENGYQSLRWRDLFRGLAQTGGDSIHRGFARANPGLAGGHAHGHGHRRDSAAAAGQPQMPALFAVWNLPARRGESAAASPVPRRKRRTRRAPPAHRRARRCPSTLRSGQRRARGQERRRIRHRAARRAQTNGAPGADLAGRAVRAGTNQHAGCRGGARTKYPDLLLFVRRLVLWDDHRALAQKRRAAPTAISGRGIAGYQPGAWRARSWPPKSATAAPSCAGMPRMSPCRPSTCFAVWPRTANSATAPNPCLASRARRRGCISRTFRACSSARTTAATWPSISPAATGGHRAIRSMPCSRWPTRCWPRISPSFCRQSGSTRSWASTIARAMADPRWPWT